MIVSHKNRFIFLKTFKTGGTSAEILLSKYAGPRDILSPLGEDEALRMRITGKSAQGQSGSFAERRLDDIRGLLRGKNIRSNIREHAKAYQIRNEVGEKIWKEYFKFTIVRNPYDRMISRFFYSKNLKGSAIDHYELNTINQMIRYNANYVNENWSIYTISDNIVVDFALRYEMMELDMKQLTLRIGLPDGLYNEYKGILTKSEFRKDRAERTNLLDEDSIEIIYRLCIKEFESFGYSRDPSTLFPASTGKVSQDHANERG